MLEEALNALSVRADGVYCDGTFGRGGHSEAIVAQLGPSGRLIGIDRDAQAIEAGRQRFKSASHAHARVDLVHDRFSNLPTVLAGLGVHRLDGVLFDLGVSSPQLDQAERGFSFVRDGPLDMRMDPSSGEPAWQWLERVDEQELIKVISGYGEERFARAIAKAIVARREDNIRPAPPTTTQLADLVAGAAGRHRSPAPPAKHRAHPTFQPLPPFTQPESDEPSHVHRPGSATAAPAPPHRSLL